MHRRFRSEGRRPITDSWRLGGAEHQLCAPGTQRKCEGGESEEEMAQDVSRATPRAAGTRDNGHRYNLSKQRPACIAGDEFHWPARMWDVLREIIGQDEAMLVVHVHVAVRADMIESEVERWAG